MTDYEVERALGCTPCVCGDLETWHSKCYRGKTTEELDALHKAAMRKARDNLKRQANKAIRSALQGPEQGAQEGS